MVSCFQKSLQSYEETMPFGEEKGSETLSSEWRAWCLRAGVLGIWLGNIRASDHICLCNLGKSLTEKWTSSYLSHGVVLRIHGGMASCSINVSSIIWKFSVGPKHYVFASIVYIAMFWNLPAVVPTLWDCWWQWFFNHAQSIPVQN